MDGAGLVPVYELKFIKGAIFAAPEKFGVGMNREVFSTCQICRA